MSNKTIATVLARPIRRWEFLVGHWFGVTLFSLCSLAIGVMLGAGLSWYFGIEIDRGRAGDRTRANGGRRHVVRRRSASASARIRRWRFAAAISVLLVFVSPMVTILSHDTRPWQRYSGVVLDYLTPPGYTSHYQGIAWADPPANPRVSARSGSDRSSTTPWRGTASSPISVTARAYFLAGCLFFMRRDIRLG